MLKDIVLKSQQNILKLFIFFFEIFFEILLETFFEKIKKYISKKITSLPPSKK
jgi:hypothetical protein